MVLGITPVSGMVVRLPYRHLLVDTKDPKTAGELYQLASDSNPRLLQNDLNSHTASGVNFFHISCEDFTQKGVSSLKVIDGVEVEKTVITNPNHDLSPDIRSAEVGHRFVCLIDVEFKDSIPGISKFVDELNSYYKTHRGEDETKVLILFSDQEPPCSNGVDTALPFEVDDDHILKRLWNDPVWGYVRIHGNREPSIQPEHDDINRSLVVTDFSGGLSEIPTGIFGYQNFVIQNVFSRFYTGLYHFLNQLESLKYSLVRSASYTYTDNRTEQILPTSILHSVAYDPLILHQPGVIKTMESASIYCNLSRANLLWMQQKAKPWNGAEQHRSLWDFADGSCGNPYVRKLSSAFVAFLRHPEPESFDLFHSEVTNFTRSVLSKAEGYGKFENLNELIFTIRDIGQIYSTNPAQRNSHYINARLTNDLIELEMFLQDEVIPKKAELEEQFNNADLVVACLRAMYSDRLHKLIHKLFTDSTEPRVISTYNIHWSD